MGCLYWISILYTYSIYLHDTWGVWIIYLQTVIQQPCKWDDAGVGLGNHPKLNVTVSFFSRPYEEKIYCPGCIHPTGFGMFWHFWCCGILDTENIPDSWNSTVARETACFQDEHRSAWTEWLRPAQFWSQFHCADFFFCKDNWICIWMDDPHMKV